MVRVHLVACALGWRVTGSLIISYLIIFDAGSLNEHGAPGLPRLAVQDLSVPASPVVGLHTHAALRRFDTGAGDEG